MLKLIIKNKMETLFFVVWILINGWCICGTQVEVDAEIPDEDLMGSMGVPPGEYEEYEEDYYDGTFYEYPCRDRSPRVPCFEEVD